MFQVGDAIAEWIVVKRNNLGMTGTVYHAHHRDREHDLCWIHVIDLLEGESRESKLSDTFRSLRTLRVSGVAPIIEVDRLPNSEQAYLAIVPPDGTSLSSQIRKGPLPMETAAAIFVQIGDGLRLLHMAGITHRQLHPDLIFVDSNERAMLLGVGLCELAHHRFPITPVSLDYAPYMPPEALQPQPCDPKTADIYAINLMLYEALTGRQLFSTSNYLPTDQRLEQLRLTKINSQPLDPGTARIWGASGGWQPKFPSDLRDILRDCTDPNINNRHRNLKQFVETLRKLCTHHIIGQLSSPAFGHEAPIEPPPLDEAELHDRDTGQHKKQKAVKEEKKATAASASTAPGALAKETSYDQRQSQGRKTHEFDAALEKRPSSNTPDAASSQAEQKDSPATSEEGQPLSPDPGLSMSPLSPGAQQSLTQWQQEGQETDQHGKRRTSSATAVHQPFTDAPPFNQRKWLLRTLAVLCVLALLFVAWRQFEVGPSGITQRFRPLVAPVQYGTIYSLTGHGERKLNSQDPSDLEALKVSLEEQGWPTESLRLKRNKEQAVPKLPSDASVLLIVAPKEPFSWWEQAAIRDFLRDGGHLAFFLEPDSFVPSLLQDVGVTRLPGLVLEHNGGLENPEHWVVGFEQHPITNTIATASAGPTVTTVSPLIRRGAMGIPHDILLKTSRHGWIEREHRTDNTHTFNPDIDTPGPTDVAFVLTVAPPHDLAPSDSISRVLVIGDADIFSSALLNQDSNNKQFLTNAIRWLLGGSSSLLPTEESLVE